MGSMTGRPLQFDGDAAVDAAVEIFWRKGYATTTPQQLAELLLAAVRGVSVLARSGAEPERLERVLAGAVASL
ncbi:hypothetical protein [Pseudonocardia sp. GCM10023141]|uniref:hypothetical protein n=1 Tax=Pseudonocardia sp. GCM10023141 TaxID=3252653 RepID=UPI0036188D13